MHSNSWLSSREGSKCRTWMVYEWNTPASSAIRRSETRSLVTVMPQEAASPAKTESYNKSLRNKGWWGSGMTALSLISLIDPSPSLIAHFQRTNWGSRRRWGRLTRRISIELRLVTHLWKTKATRYLQPILLTSPSGRVAHPSRRTPQGNRSRLWADLAPTRALWLWVTCSLIRETLSTGRKECCPSWTRIHKGMFAHLRVSKPSTPSYRKAMTTIATRRLQPVDWLFPPMSLMVSCLTLPPPRCTPTKTGSWESATDWWGLKLPTRRRLRDTRTRSRV